MCFNQQDFEIYIYMQKSLICYQHTHTHIQKQKAARELSICFSSFRKFGKKIKNINNYLVSDVVVVAIIVDACVLSNLVI